MIAAIGGFLRGAGYLLQGFALLPRPGVRRHVILPLLVNFLLFALFMVLGVSQLDGLLEAAMAYLPQWLQWLEWLLWPLFLAGVLLAGFYLTLLLAGLVAAPFNGLLSEAVERVLGGSAGTDGDTGGGVFTGLLADFLAELRKLGYFLWRALPLLLLFLVPGINLAAPLLWLLFSAWMLALEYLDYPLSAHGHRFPRYRHRLRHQWHQGRALALGFGAAASLLTLVPLFNFLVMPAAVAGATTMALREGWLQEEAAR